MIHQTIMEDTYTLTLSSEYNSTSNQIFKKIEDGTVFDLTGADEITFYFKEDGAFSLLFHERGEIFGTITKIITDEKIEMLWNVTGFDKPEERNTILEIIIERIDENKSRLAIINSGIQNKESFDAKESAWKEILEDLQKEFPG